MANEGSRINFRQHGNPELLEIFFSHLLRAPIGADFRELAHNQTLDVGPGGFVIFRIRAVISDFRVGENYNLAAVGRVGENFLIAGDGSIKNDLARTFAFRAVAFASEDPAVFQSKRSLHQCSREWILEILAGMWKLSYEKSAAAPARSPTHTLLHVHMDPQFSKSRHPSPEAWA